jgi:hypothetical protein
MQDVAAGEIGMPSIPDSPCQLIVKAVVSLHQHHLAQSAAFVDPDVPDHLQHDTLS